MNFRVSKKLTANDLGITGGRQSGVTVSKKTAAIDFFPRLNPKEFNPRQTLQAIDFHTRDMLELEYIYYNGKLHDKELTRDEYRLTKTDKFLHRHRAVVGDILHIEQEIDLFWLSIDRIVAGVAQDEELPTFTEKQIDKSWSTGSTGRFHPEDQDFQIEGGFQRVLSNRFERSRLNRRVAIELHGRECSVCGFSFEASYGRLSGGYVEIHHLVPVSMMQRPTRVDPRVDLVPLCANCHRMAHRVWPPISPDELKRAMSTEGT